MGGEIISLRDLASRLQESRKNANNRAMSVKGKSTGIKLDRETLAERVRQFHWFHSIDLGYGVITPGSKSPAIHQAEYAAFFDPGEFRGRSVIDIGAWNGALVLLLGVFYHLLDPIAVLQQIAKLTREVLIVETHTDALGISRPAMIMYPGSELSNDPTNWWGPNPACMVALLKECGFAKVDAAWSMEHRSVYHAWRTDALRRSRNLDERVIGPTETRRRKLRRGWRLIREGLGLRRER